MIHSHLTKYKHKFLIYGISQNAPIKAYLRNEKKIMPFKRETHHLHHLCHNFCFLITVKAEIQPLTCKLGESISL